MRLLLAIQGQWGRRIADHLRGSAPPDWQIAVWQGPTALPLIVDNPEEFLPDHLAPAELLVVLPESAVLTDLAPDLASRCGARAVLLGIDRRPWAPRGLVRQVRQRLAQAGIACAAPIPFCSLAPSARQHPLIRAFAERYGRPELRCSIQNETARPGHIVECRILRETPCGNTRYIVEHLPGTPRDQAVERAGLLHHYYPCWGGMETDPVQSAGGQIAPIKHRRDPSQPDYSSANHSSPDHSPQDHNPPDHSPPDHSPPDHSPPDHSPLHIAATLAQKSVARAIQNSESEGETT